MTAIYLLEHRYYILKIDFSMFNFIFKIKYKILRCIGYLFARLYYTKLKFYVI